MPTDDGKKELEKPQEGQEQQNESSTIDWSTIDVASIPEEVIRTSPAFKALLTESIERRQEIAKLRGTQPKQSEDKKLPEANQAADNSGEIAQLKEALALLVNMAAADRQERLVDKVIQAHKLPDNPRIRKMLADESSPDGMNTLAAELVNIFGVKPVEPSKQSPVTQTTSTGQPVTDDNPAHNDLRKRIMDKLQGNGNILGEGVFSTGTQRQRGGGYN